MASPLSNPTPAPAEPVGPGAQRASRRRGPLALAALGVAVVLAACGGTAAPSPALGTSGTGAIASVGGGGPSAAAASTSSATDNPSSGAAASSPAATLAPGTTSITPASASGSPWTAWEPAGKGSESTFSLPAPWTGGIISKVQVVAYLPPGYATSTRAYPVVYEAPFSFNLFDQWIHLGSVLDAKITSGALPAAIYVFTQPAHSPIHDTECANSADGRQWVDTFLATTVVQAVDQRFRTIPTAAARSVMGFSQGGFCAAMLALEHPDVFSTAISISGYYQAGIKDGQTPTAWMPFLGRASAEAAASPLQLVTKLTPAQRQSMLLILEADPAQPFYGPQYKAMLAAAHQAGVAVVAVPMSLPHSWPVVAASLPKMLASMAQHEVRLGVFG